MKFASLGISKLAVKLDRGKPSVGTGNHYNHQAVRFQLILLD